MPETTEQASKPPRTWRPMAAWTGAILLALGLAWFVGAVVVPVWRVRRVVAEYAGQPTAPSTPWPSVGDELIERLGGQKNAAVRLATYLRLPKWLAPHRTPAVIMLSSCGEHGTEALVRALFDDDEGVREQAAAVLRPTAGNADVVTDALARALGDSRPPDIEPLFSL